jgi:hypothetical protein
MQRFKGGWLAALRAGWRAEAVVRGVGLRAGTRGVCRRADRLLALFPHAGIPLPSSGRDPPKGVFAPQLPRQAPRDAA